MKTTTHFRVITPGSFSNINTIITDERTGANKLIQTAEEAKKVINDFGHTNSNEHKEYWHTLQKQCKVVKVTTIIEDVVC